MIVSPAAGAAPTTPSPRRATRRRPASATAAPHDRKGSAAAGCMQFASLGHEACGVKRVEGASDAGGARSPRHIGNRAPTANVGASRSGSRGRARHPAPRADLIADTSVARPSPDAREPSRSGRLFALGAAQPVLAWQRLAVETTLSPTDRRRRASPPRPAPSRRRGAARAPDAAAATRPPAPSAPPATSRRRSVASARTAAATWRPWPRPASARARAARTARHSPTPTPRAGRAGAR